VLGPDLEPLRVDSNFNIVDVPTYDLTAMGKDDDEVMSKVLAAAASQNPLKLAEPGQVDLFFWVKNNRHVKSILIHPSLVGKVRIPVGVPVYKSEALPKDQMTCLGPPSFAGFYVEHGHRRGILAHDKKGLLAVQFSVLA
jgi:hypothetical protein